MDWNSDAITSLVRGALAEDVGPGDATTLAVVAPDTRADARILARRDLVCAGLPLAERVFRELDAKCRIEPACREGESVSPGKDLARISGSAQAILTGERTALNFLAHLCGIATLTSLFVKELAGTHAKIRDTRKTTPGLRALEKYAVRAGGGENHRFGLYDAILVKENHIALAGGIRAAISKARAYSASIPIQVEVRNEAELQEAVDAGAESLLLDNMTVEQATRCVSQAHQRRPNCVAEISGGITLANARAYALTGANYLSAGALTHSVPAADLSLLVESTQRT
ncbi:MAG TPA: carboxylating nicotinate-nucleotide diphosphorylase [Methylomirabilota bacterium]|nr:carboxylating nicotinate-nucleotide diphosphorylase [Methylomirabilota bacterium]